MKIYDTIPVDKTFRVKGKDYSLFRKGEQNQLRIWFRAEGFWVVYPENKQWRVLKDIEQKGVVFVEEPPKYTGSFGKKVLAKLTPPYFAEQE